VLSGQVDLVPARSEGVQVGQARQGGAAQRTVLVPAASDPARIWALGQGVRRRIGQVDAVDGDEAVVLPGDQFGAHSGGDVLVQAGEGVDHVVAAARPAAGSPVMACRAAKAFA